MQMIFFFQKSNSTAQKATIIYALGFLNADEAFKMVSDTATMRNVSTLIRSAAIFSMMPQHTSPSRRHQVHFVPLENTKPLQRLFVFCFLFS